MPKRARKREMGFSSLSFLDILANTIGALVFILIMFVVVTSHLVNPIAFEFLTESLPDAIAEQNYSMVLSARGGETPYEWRIADGDLPPGFLLTNETGMIKGMPQSDKTGTYKFKVNVTEHKGKSLGRELNLTILPASIRVDEIPPLQIVTESLPNATAGSRYPVALAATGGIAPYKWSIVGDLPLGLSLKEDEINGTPTSDGTWGFEIKVEDTRHDTQAQSLSLTVDPKPIGKLLDLNIRTIRTLPSAPIKEPYVLTLAATGGVPPYTWSIDGELPPGLKLNAEKGEIWGTPKEEGTFVFTAHVTDSQDIPDTDEQEHEITVGIPGGIPEKKWYETWWIVVLATIGVILGVFFVLAVFTGIRCPKCETRRCRNIGGSIYECRKCGFKFKYPLYEPYEESV